MVERSTDDTFSTTPETMNFFKDARDMEGAGKYPNYWTHKTRSGHVFMLDDSKGAEHVTLQHRTGSMIQFMPDGAVQFTSHNGEYNMVFGAKRVKITGAYDITVEKAASLRVEGGDYNVTVPNGSVNYTIGKNFNIITGENFNVQAKEDVGIKAKNYTAKIENNISVTASQGAQYLAAQKGMTMVSTGDAVAIGAAKDVGIAAGADMMLSSEVDTHIYATNALKQQAQNGDVEISAYKGNISQVATAGSINQQSMQDFNIESKGKFIATALRDASLLSSQNAILKGLSSVNISSPAGPATVYSSSSLFLTGMTTVELFGGMVNIKGAPGTMLPAYIAAISTPSLVKYAKLMTPISGSPGPAVSTAGGGYGFPGSGVY